MKGERYSMKMLCDKIQIRPVINDNEKKSMLVLGGSRMGKTFFVSNLGAELIAEGVIVHMIDLGGKWSANDKERLSEAGAKFRFVAEHGVTFIFGTKQEILNCARYVCNALGISSENAIEMLKDAIRRTMEKLDDNFGLQDLLHSLQDIEGRDQEYRKWAKRLHDRLSFSNEALIIRFVLEKKRKFATCSVIWELDGLEDSNVKIMASLILYCIYCQLKRNFKIQRRDNVFVIIDEFQVLECDRHSIFGICLAEGQKYGLSLILATQFLQGNFSEAVINQFKQGGFRYYFRLTEEEARGVSSQLAYNARDRQVLYHRLISLPVGTCLMVGPHFVGNRKEISENVRFVEIHAEGEEHHRKRCGGFIVDLFWGGGDGKMTLI